MSERIRLQADEDFNNLIVKGLQRRQPLIDFQTTAEVGLRGVPDPARLALAAGQDQILVSHDLATMPTHFTAFLESGHHSPGLFLIPKTVPIGEAIDALALIWEASSPDDWRDLITYLPL